MFREIQNSDDSVAIFGSRSKTTEPVLLPRRMECLSPMAAELWRVRDRRRGYVRCESEAESVARTAWLEGDSEEQALALAAFEDRLDDLADNGARAAVRMGRRARG